MSIKKLYATEEEWISTGLFNIGYYVVGGKRIRYAMSVPSDGVKPEYLVTMVGGIPRDPARRKNLPLINKLYGLLATHLIDHRMACLMYNQPATGNSEGVWEKETLFTRSQTLLNLAVSIGSDLGVQNHVVVGSSAGAYMASTLIDSMPGFGHTLRSLVLISPAAYPQCVEHVPYGDKFSHMIKRDWDIVRSPVFFRLERFAGSLFVSFYAEDDPPIPKKIQDHFWYLMSHRCLTNPKTCFMTIEGVGHNFLRLNRKHRQSIINNESIIKASNDIKDFVIGN